jgi:hypothetical protein
MATDVSGRLRFTLWTLHKNGKTVTCLWFTDRRVLQCELQLVSGDETFSHDCQFRDVSSTQLWWKEAMLKRGWQPHDAD